MPVIRSAAGWTRLAANIYQGVSAGDYLHELTLRMERDVGAGMMQWTSVDRTSKSPIETYWSTPTPRSLMEEWDRHIMPHDPRFAGILARYGELLPCWKLVDVEAFEKSVVVGDWADRKDVDRRWCAACILDIDAAHAGLFAFLRPRIAGAYQIRELDPIKRLRGHLRRAAQLHFLFREQSPRGRAFDDAWGARSRAVYILGRGWRLLAMNQAGQKLLSKGDVLQTRWGELVPRAPRLQRTLNNALTAALRFDLDIYPRPIAVAWPRSDGVSTLVIEIMSLPGIAAEVGLGENAQALVICRNVRHGGASSPFPSNTR